MVAPVRRKRFCGPLAGSPKSGLLLTDRSVPQVPEAEATSAKQLGQPEIGNLLQPAHEWSIPTGLDPSTRLETGRLSTKEIL
jgi:hypothetical protein